MQASNPQDTNVPQRRARSVEIASQGLNTTSQLTKLFSALMTDVLEENISPVTCNAVCNAGGKLLKTVELQARYGKPGETGEKDMVLVDESRDQQIVEDFPSPEELRRRELRAELEMLERGDRTTTPLRAAATA